MLQDCVLLARSPSVLWPRLASRLLFLLKLPVMANGTDGPDCPCLASSRTSPQPVHSLGPYVSPQGHQPLPQRHYTGADLQLPTALPCPAMGLAKPGLPPRLTSWPSLCPSQSPGRCPVPWAGAAPEPPICLAPGWAGRTELALREPLALRCRALASPRHLLVL